MTDPRLLAMVDLAVGLTCLALALLLVLVKITRRLYTSSRVARAAPYRPALLAIAAGGDEDGTAFAALRDIPGRAWPAVRRVAIGLLGKVCGDTAEQLVRLLDAHGELDRARSDLRSSSAVRRARGAYLLGLARQADDLTGLMRLLVDRSADVRAVAARALARLGRPAAATALLNALRPIHGQPGIPTAVVAEALFELLAPALELFGLALVLIGVAFGVVGLDYLGLFLAVAYGYRVLVTLAAMTSEELSFAKYRRWRDLGLALLAGVLENIGYRQAIACWQVEGWWSAVRGRQGVWGTMPRRGFADRAEHPAGRHD